MKITPSLTMQQAATPMYVITKFDSFIYNKIS